MTLTAHIGSLWRYVLWYKIIKWLFEERFARANLMVKTRSQSRRYLSFAAYAQISSVDLPSRIPIAAQSDTARCLHGSVCKHGWEKNNASSRDTRQRRLKYLESRLECDTIARCCRNRPAPRRNGHIHIYLVRDTTRLNCDQSIYVRPARRKLLEKGRNVQPHRSIDRSIGHLGERQIFATRNFLRN